MLFRSINGWRAEWKQGDFPFYYCQIAPYDYGIITEKGKEIINSAYLREAQSKVEHRVKNSGMAVLLDAGMEKGIHPSKKKTAGERLALLALTKTYGIEGVNGESPYYKSIEIKNDTVIVSFERANMWISGKDCFESQNFSLSYYYGNYLLFCSNHSGPSNPAGSNVSSCFREAFEERKFQAR